MSIYYGVICKACGPVELTKAQYISQLSAAGALWRCPKCAQAASWDDTRYERSCADHWAAQAQAEEQKKTAAPLVAAGFTRGAGPRKGRVVDRDFSVLELHVIAAGYGGRSLVSRLGYQPEDG